MSASIDPRKAHAAYRSGDITIILSWMNDNIRCMFLIPSHRSKAPWFIIPEPNAHKWNDQDNDNWPELLLRGSKACEVLGIEPNQRNTHRIINLVNNHLQELLRMPTAQPPELTAGTFGHMELKEGGKTLLAREVRYEKNEGATYG